MYKKGVRWSAGFNCEDRYIVYFSLLFLTISQPENTFNSDYKYFIIYPTSRGNINITKVIVVQ